MLLFADFIQFYYQWLQNQIRLVFASGNQNMKVIFLFYIQGQIQYER